MANNTKHKIKIVVGNFPTTTEFIYICGNTSNLGNWDAKRAIMMTPVKGESSIERFERDFMFTEGDIIEYKFLAGKDWANVETGYVAEDIPNRSFTVKNKNRIICEEIKKFKE
jgi:hypothetical protein